MSEVSASFSWMPAVLFVLGGLAVGLFLVWWTRRKGGATETARPQGPLPVEVRDLEEKEAALLEQLEELEDTAGKYTPERLVEHRRRIELAAAETLRELEVKLEAHRAAGERRREAEHPGGTEAAPAAAAGSGIFVRHPALKGFLWGAGAMGAMALLFFSVSRSTAPRAPGQEVTGSVGGQSSAGAGPGAQAPTPSPAEIQEGKALDARIQANPDDLDARIDKARLDIGQADWMGAWNETQYVLKRSPGNPEALTYQSLVRFAMGQPQMAVDMLKQALEKDPDLVDAYGILSLVYAKTGKLDLARGIIERGEARLPQHRAMFEQMYAQLEQQVASGSQGGGAGGEEEAAGGPASGAAAAPAAAPAGTGSVEVANGTPRLAGVVELAPGAAGEVPPGGVLFVFIRPAGVTSGPPTAVKRFVSPTFPLHFALGDGDSMMGQPFPEKMHVEARLDSDGNPMTQGAGDLHAELDDQPLGASDLRLDLKR